MISTRDLSKLPDIDGLRRLLQSLAMLDAILQPEWEYRWYSFNSKWSRRRRGEQMGSMRTGSGDEFSAHFTKAGCWFKGFDHEAPMSPYREQPPKLWPGVLDSVPKVFAQSISEPAFEATTATTFCIWRQFSDTEWQVGEIEFPKGHKDPDGSEWMLSALDGRPASYQEHAGQIGERELRLDAIRHVYEHKPLTPEIVEELNPAIVLSDLEDDIAEIGYPA